MTQMGGEQRTSVETASFASMELDFVGAVHCPHIESLSALQNISSNVFIHKEECTQCFDDHVSGGWRWRKATHKRVETDVAIKDSETGIDLCLSCFNGGCTENRDRCHSSNHFRLSKHPLALNIQRKLKHRDPQVHFVNNIITPLLEGWFREFRRYFDADQTGNSCWTVRKGFVWFQVIGEVFWMQMCCCEWREGCIYAERN